MEEAVVSAEALFSILESLLLSHWSSKVESRIHCLNEHIAALIFSLLLPSHHHHPFLPSSGICGRAHSTCATPFLPLSCLPCSTTRATMDVQKSQATCYREDNLPEFTPMPYVLCHFHGKSLPHSVCRTPHCILN